MTSVSTPGPRSGAEAGKRYPMSEVRVGGREELPHVRGQGLRLGVSGCDGEGAAERSYPTTKERGSGWECQAATAQEWPRGATAGPRSGAAAERSYPPPEVTGGSREELPHVQGVLAVRAQEGREKLLHIQGQEGLR